MRIGSIPLSLLGAIALSQVGNGLLATAAGARLAGSALPETASGFVLACYFAGLTWGTLRLPRTLCRIGHIRGFAAFTALAAGASIAHSFLPVGWGWGLLRAVSGIAMAGIYLSVESWLNASAEPASRGRVLAGYLLSLYLGTALGQLLVPVWPLMGSETFAFAGMALAFAVIPVSMTSQPAPSLPSASRMTALELLEKAPIGWVGAFTSGFIVATIYANVPLSSDAEGFSSAELSRLMVAFVIGGLLGQWPIGRLSDHMDRRIVLLGVGVALGGFAVALYFLPDPTRALGTCYAAAFGALAFTIYPLAVAHTLDRISGANALPATSQMLLASSVGAVLGPIVAAVGAQLFGPRAFYAVDAALLGVLTLGTLVRLALVAPTRRRAFVSIPRTTPVVNRLAPSVVPAATAADATGEPPSDALFDPALVRDEPA